MPGRCSPFLFVLISGAVLSAAANENDSKQRVLDADSADSSRPATIEPAINPADTLTDLHYATAFLELAERARAHADALADRGLRTAGSVLSASETAAEVEAVRAAQLRSAAAAAAEASWRFGGNFVPQHLGQWRMQDGSWNFGNDRRIECEACNYVLYMLIDRLGDQFSRVTINQEAQLLCPRVQWVFKSACDFIVRKNQAIIADLIMKLIEPVDICKHLTLCPPDLADLMGAGSMQGYGQRSPFPMPPQFRPSMGPAGVMPRDAIFHPWAAGGNGWDMWGNPKPVAGAPAPAGGSPPAAGAAAAPAAAAPAGATPPAAAGGGGGDPAAEPAPP